MRRRCLCKCHEGGHGDRLRADGVDLCDRVEAIVACRDCRTYHEQALAELPSCDVSHPKAGWNGEEGG